MRRHLWSIPLLLASSAACSEPPSTEIGRAAVGSMETTNVQHRSQGASVEGLPFSQGRSFSSLDEYLAFLRKRGAYDVPWYREIRPGVYELVTRRAPGSQAQIFTREELERRFGFTD